MRNADMPAMPIVLEPGEVWSETQDCAHGLTKREHFAAMALPRIEVFSKDGKASDTEVAKKAALIAVMTADALLAELEKTQ